MDELIRWRDAKMNWSCNSCYDFQMEKSTKVHKFGLKYVLILFYEIFKSRIEKVMSLNGH